LARIGFVLYYGGFVGCGMGFWSKIIEKVLGVLQIGLLFGLP